MTRKEKKYRKVYRKGGYGRVKPPIKAVERKKSLAKWE